ncbi:endochitinase [Coprinopsis sp. MPI-PUGE-AT-0042]|nr:endochitinase [Coprinopsis sp. MPI-PUGE-AT-0042]
MQLPLFLLSLTCSALAVQEQRLSARAPSANPIAASWYAGWHIEDFPLAQVSWDKYTHLTYSFAVTTASAPFALLEEWERPRLREFVRLAKRNNVVASLSVGGWGGSRYFSYAVGSERNRTAFVGAILDLAKEYELDGIDFDWEYPGMQGMGCNIVNANDTSNFLSFLQELRGTQAGADLVLSSAVYVDPFTDASGVPSTDVSGFAQVFDYIAVMNYDVKINEAIGASSRSPMDDRCAPAGAKWGSAVTSIEAWHKAGIPLDKLVLGVPGHGHSYFVSPAIAVSRNDSSQLNSYPSFSSKNRKLGDRWDGEGSMDVCGVTWGPGGVYTYWGLTEEGFLNQDGSVRDGILYRYDECSETPWVYSPDKQVLVSYENERSMAAKGDYIYNTGLRGFAMWETGADRNDTLLDAIKSASLNGNPGVRTAYAKSVVDNTTVGESGLGAASPDQSSAQRPSLALLRFGFLIGIWTLSSL